MVTEAISFIKRPRCAAGSTMELGFHIARVDVTGCNQIHDPDEMRQKLATLIEVQEDGLTPEQSAIVKDFYFYLFAFSREKSFSQEKTSTLLSICRDVFDGDMSTNDPAKHMGTSFERLQKMLLRHAVFRPPKSIGVFDEGDVQAILNWMLHNYFRNWRLYKVIFTKRLQCTFTQVGPFGVEEPAPYRPLVELLPLGDAPAAEEVGGAGSVASGSAPPGDEAAATGDEAPADEGDGEAPPADAE